MFQPLSTGISHGTSDQYFFFIELNRLNRATAVDTSRGDQCPASQGRGFNGATAFQPWILDYAAGSLRHDCLLQWSHGLSAVDTWLNRCLPFRISGCFNGATAFQPWIRDLCVMFYHTPPRFNGATAFQPWIQVRMVKAAGDGYRASMEPRLFSRGYLVSSLKTPPIGISFNGATAFQPWIHKTAPFAARAEKASMEPRLFSRGYMDGWFPIGRLIGCFNGATAFQPWIPDLLEDTGDKTISFNGATAFQPWI